MATKAAKKESNNLFKLLTGIAPESALPGRSKAAIWTEVSVGPPWMEKLLAKGCPDESTTSTPLVRLLVVLRLVDTGGEGVAPTRMKVAFGALAHDIRRQ